MATPLQFTNVYVLNYKNNYHLESLYFCPYVRCNYPHKHRYIIFRHIRIKHDPDFVRLSDGGASLIFRTHDGRFIDFSGMHINISKKKDRTIIIYDYTTTKYIYI